MLTGEIENSIKNDGINSEFAIETVCNMYADMFASMGDELMQQRATDMRDIKTRMQKLLLGVRSVAVSYTHLGRSVWMSCTPKDMITSSGVWNLRTGTRK